MRKFLRSLVFRIPFSAELSRSSKSDTEIIASSCWPSVYYLCSSYGRFLTPCPSPGSGLLWFMTGMCHCSAAVNTHHCRSRVTIYYYWSLCRALQNSHSCLLTLIMKEIKRLWNGVLGIRVYPDPAHKHIQYSWLTQDSCVCVMDQYLLIRATLCAATLKRSDERPVSVMIHVFSVNHASGTSSQITAPLNISHEDRHGLSQWRRYSDHHKYYLVGDFVKHQLWLMDFNDTMIFL